MAVGLHAAPACAARERCFRARAEIGDATVGSLASCTSKDSSVKGPGYFGALVASVTYVDHNGEVHLDFQVSWFFMPCQAVQHAFR